MEFKKFEKRIYLSSPTMHGPEMEYMKLAYDTNWMSTVGENINERKKMKKLIIVGAGGFGRELLQWVKDINKKEQRWTILGFIDDNMAALDGYDCDYSVIGTIRDCVPEDDIEFACAIANPEVKQKVTNYLKGKNEVFETINNISSIYAAREYLLDGECFICEADLFVSDDSIFMAELKESCYYGKMVEGHSDDWVFEQDFNGIITRVGKGGDDCYNMTGIAYFTEKDAKVLYNAMEAEYGKIGYCW